MKEILVYKVATTSIVGEMMRQMVEVLIGLLLIYIQTSKHIPCDEVAALAAILVLVTNRWRV